MKMTDEILTVEIPLDPEYLTEDGFYMAGYMWGLHVRGPESWGAGEREQVEKYPDFLKGVEDGYGDSLQKMKTPPDKHLEPTIEKMKILNEMIAQLEKQHKEVVTNHYNQTYDFDS